MVSSFFSFFKSEQFSTGFIFPMAFLLNTLRVKGFSDWKKYLLLTQVGCNQGGAHWNFLKYFVWACHYVVAIADLSPFTRLTEIVDWNCCAYRRLPTFATLLVTTMRLTDLQIYFTQISQFYLMKKICHKSWHVVMSRQMLSCTFLANLLILVQKVNRIKGQFFIAVTAFGHINAYLCPLSPDLKNIHLLAKRLKKDQWGTSRKVLFRFCQSCHHHDHPEFDCGLLIRKSENNSLDYEQSISRQNSMVTLDEKTIWIICIILHLIFKKFWIVWASVMSCKTSIYFIMISIESKQEGELLCLLKQSIPSKLSCVWYTVDQPVKSPILLLLKTFCCYNIASSFFCQNRTFSNCFGHIDQTRIMQLKKSWLFPFVSLYSKHV